MYKILGVWCLREGFCPASIFVTADSDEPANPNNFIHVLVRHKARWRKIVNIIALWNHPENSCKNIASGFKARVWQPIPATILSLPHTCFMKRKTNEKKSTVPIYDMNLKSLWWIKIHIMTDYYNEGFNSIIITMFSKILIF